MAKKRLEWRVSPSYTMGLLALILVGPSKQFAEEVYCVCSFQRRDVNSMLQATTRAATWTKEYRAKRWRVNDRQITLQAMLDV